MYSHCPLKCQPLSFPHWIIVMPSPSNCPYMCPFSIFNLIYSKFFRICNFKVITRISKLHSLLGEFAVNWSYSSCFFKLQQMSFWKSECLEAAVCLSKILTGLKIIVLRACNNHIKTTTNTLLEDFLVKFYHLWEILLQFWGHTL